MISLFQLPFEFGPVSRPARFFILLPALASPRYVGRRKMMILLSRWFSIMILSLHRHDYCRYFITSLSTMSPAPLIIAYIDDAKYLLLRSSKHCRPSTYWLCAIDFFRLFFRCHAKRTTTALSLRPRSHSQCFHRVSKLMLLHNAARILTLVSTQFPLWFILRYFIWFLFSPKQGFLQPQDFSLNNKMKFSHKFYFHLCFLFSQFLTTQRFLCP